MTSTAPSRTRLRRLLAVLGSAAASAGVLSGAPVSAAVLAACVTRPLSTDRPR